MKARTFFRRLNSVERGFTLIEILVGIVITSILGVGITITINQMITVDAMNNTRLTAVKQVENAVHQLSWDIQMSQTIQVGANAGFPLTLNWTEWDNSQHQVIYSLQGNELRRSWSVNTSPPQTQTVARYIDPAGGQTNCQFNSGTFTGKITAVVSGFRPASESRTIQILPRAAQ